MLGHPARGGSRHCHETLQETKGWPQGGPGRQMAGQQDTAGSTTTRPTDQQDLAWEGRKGWSSNTRLLLSHPPGRSSFTPHRHSQLGTDSSSHAPPPGSWPWWSLPPLLQPQVLCPQDQWARGSQPRASLHSFPGWVLSPASPVGPRGPAHSLPCEQDSSPQLCLWEEP